MDLTYSITHNGNTWTSSTTTTSVAISNGSVTDTITTAGTRTLNCKDKIAANNLVIGEKTLHCAGKVMTGNVVIRTQKLLPDLCFKANTAGSTISMRKIGSPSLGQNFSYSTDSENWSTFTPGTTTITLTNVGDRVYFRGNNPNGINQTESTFYYFIMTGSIAASGNIMSLIDNGACNTVIIPNGFCYGNLFRSCKSLTTAPSLPATTLTVECYKYMFYECEALTTAPSLPATTLADYCYSQMFYGCDALTTAPSLPATTLADYCYYCMFGTCKSLTTPPALLPATTLAKNCYMQMFNACVKLTTAPTLPATTLADYCYAYMFQSCYKLTTLPALPATTLAEACYFGMFVGCDSLYVSDSSGSSYSHAWRIPTTGTFTNTQLQNWPFEYCLGTRSSDDLAGEQGHSYTYYTQNAPV